ncbi:N-acetyl-gamma-glutamyl-phosphate reductase [Sphingomonas sp. BIUV-7]|uniref:N-acetyl-gamma-glutamyl-phosphate reductase n=1 Tax=Sphingomonas natans TaxID=3063330 RepID=A0ABT8YBH0_9SPHN|nr:N-acetyl-gamma-glutamyl-phosphate reductase [Sphingomonas sp. BIUV-7]MDO6415675.1 N-acetyl-gamma-glutamyl-phosphate reductase [Sphingomonas sp. BIUV-7]
MKIFVDGAVGTTGLEIGERLAGRPEIELLTLSEALRKDASARGDALNAADIVILCLPDDAAREAVALLEGSSTRIIDASTAHRIAPGWAYGFPELEPGCREAIGAADYVANPGCYPTGFLALVRPLVRAGLLPADALLSVNATSGYSGGGKSMIASFEDPADPAATDTAFRTYAMNLAHKHAPEMTVHAGLTHAPIFQPAVAKTYRGMIVEVPLHLHALPGTVTLADLRAALADHYAGSALVRVVDNAPPVMTIEQLAGTDRIDLFVYGDEKAGQARLVAALDNLGKGAAGAAVQNMNLMAGLPETAGLQL